VGGCGFYDSALRWGVAICLGIDLLVGAIDRIVSATEMGDPFDLSYNGGHCSIRRLMSDILAENKRQAKQKLNAMIREGLNSGESIEATPEWWERQREKLLQSL
jgi:hypothetical protein